MLLTAEERAEAYTQLAILLITLGSVTGDKPNHQEAVRLLGTARELAPLDPYPLAYLGFV